MTTPLTRHQKKQRERVLKALAPFCFWSTLALLVGMYVGLQKLPHERNESGHFIAQDVPQIRQAGSMSRSPASAQ